MIKSIRQLYNGRQKVMDFLEHIDQFLDNIEKTQSGHGLEITFTGFIFQLKAVETDFY